MSSKRSNLLLSKDYQSKKQSMNDTTIDDETLTQEDKINRRVQSVLKTLPSKKDENLIRFKSFYECIKDVKIMSEVQFDTYRKEDSKSEHDSTTFLYDKMLEWDELNLTKHYIQFRSNIQSFVRTLPEMLHHKDTICDIFVNHLKIKDSLAYQPILDLVTIFAKDLRQEFYPLFPRLFYPIIFNISSDNIELNELIFKSLAFLFKYLQKYIIKDISLWFEKYSKLLSHKKWYIRKFAAESFSFLINKLSDEELKIYVEKVFNLLIKKPSQIMYDGVSQMFFESMKGILGNLHSKMSRLLPLLFRQLDWNDNYNGTIKQQLSDIGNKFTLIEKCLILLRDYSKNKIIAKQIWDLFVIEIKYLVNILNNNDYIQIGYFIQLIRVFNTIEKYNDESIIKILNLLNSKNLLKEFNSQSSQALFSFISDIIEHLQRSDIIENIDNLLFNCFYIKDKQTVYTFYKKLMKTIGNEQESNTIVKEFLRFVNDDIHYNFEDTVAFLLNFIHTNYGTDEINLEFTLLSEKNSKFITIIFNKFNEMCSNIKSQQDLIQTSNLLLLWSILNILSIYGKKSDQYLKNLYENVHKFLIQIINLIDLNQYEKKEKQLLQMIIAQSLTLITNVIPHYNNNFNKLLDLIVQISCTFGTSLHVLMSCNQFLDHVDSSVLTNDKFKLIAESLKLNLQSKSDNLRLETLKYLTKFEQDDIQKGVVLNKVETAKCVLLDFLRDSEECGFDWDESRNRIVLLEKANEYLKRYNIPQIYKTLVSNFVFGSYFTKYQIVWEPTSNLASTMMRINFKEFWNLLISNISKIYVKYGEYKKSSQFKSMVYKSKRNHQDQPTLNFEKFSKTVKRIEKISDIETIYLKLIKDSSKHHTDYSTYLDMIFNVFTNGARDSKKENDILLVFNSFYENEFKEYDIDEVVNFITRNPMTGRLEKLLNLISDFRDEFFKNEEKSKFIKSVIFRLFSTSTISIQLLSLKCLQKFNLPYLNNKTVKNLQKVISSNRSVQHLCKLDFSNIPKQYQEEYIHLHLKVIEPYLLMYDMTKKRGKNSKDAMIKKWKIRVHQVIEYLGQLPKETLQYFIDMLFKRFKGENGSFAEDLIKANTFQLRWLLDIIEEILTCLTGNYHYFYNQVLDLLITIIELRIDAHEMEIDDEQEELQQKLHQLHQLHDDEDEDDEEEEDDETKSETATTTTTLTTLEESSKNQNDQMTDDDVIEEQDVAEDEDDEQEDAEDEEQVDSKVDTTSPKKEVKPIRQYYKPASSKQKVSLTLTFKRAVELLELFFDRKQEFEYSIEFTSHVISLFTKFFNNIDKKTSRIEELPSYFSILYSWFDRPRLYYLIKYYEKELLFKFIELIDQYNVSNIVFDQILNIFDKILTNKDEIFMNLNPNFSQITTDIENGLTIGKKIFEPYIVNQILHAFYNLFIQSSNKSSFNNSNTNSNTIPSSSNSNNNNNNNNKEVVSILNESLERQEFSKKCFKTIDRMKGYFDETSPADIILNIYGTSIRDGVSLHEDEARVLLHLFKKYLPYSSTEIKTMYITYFSKMFIYNNETVFRNSLCDIIEKLAIGFNSEKLKFTSKIINGLNAQEESHLTNLDTTSRIEIFKLLNSNKEMLSKLNQIELFPIIGNLIFFLGHKEWILRDSSSQSLSILIEIIVNSQFDMNEIRKTLLLHVKRLTFSDKLLEKSEPMLVYSKMMEQFIELSNAKPFSKSFELISDVNFQKKFEGLKEISSLIIPIEKCTIPQQTIYQLIAPLIYELMIINDKPIQDLIKQLCIYLVTVLDWNYSHPILNQLVTMMGTYGMKVLSKRKKIALDIICQIVDVFPFEKIFERNSMIVDYEHSQYNQKYNQQQYKQQQYNQQQEQYNEQNDDEQQDDEENDEIMPKGKRMKRYFMKDFIPRITKFLWDKKLEIYVMRMQVCFLIIKVLRRCDKTQLDNHLSKMVLDVLGKLKSKDEEQQTVAGKALIDMFKELGSSYFNFMLEKMKSVLAEEGYQTDTLYIVLESLLKVMASDHTKTAVITQAVHSVMLILLNEITYPPLKTFKKRKVSRFDTEKVTDESFSNQQDNTVSLTSDSNSSSSGSGHNKSKHFKSRHENTLFNCFELLGSIIDIKKSLSYVVNDINFKIRIVHNAEILKRFEFVFKFLLKGLMKNRQVINSNNNNQSNSNSNNSNNQSNQNNNNNNQSNNNNSEMLLNVIKKELNVYRLYKKNFKTITDGEQDRFHSTKTSKDRKEENFLVQKEPGRLGAIDQADDMKMKLLAGLIDNSHIIVQFYLKLFEKCIKRFKIQLDKHVNEMNELIPLLLKYVSGNQLNVALVSFRILIEISKRVPKTFKSLEDSKQLLLDSTFDILTNSGIDSTNQETWETIYTGIKYFLQSDISRKYPLSLGQLDVLLDMLKIEISSTRRSYTIQTFQILSNLIDNKIQIPQIYDLMDKSKTIMLTTLDMEIQKTIVEMLVNFYLNYPFTNEVLQEKLNYLFKNVLNENMSNESKLSILNLIQTIIKKFPNTFLNDKTELIYYPLILELERQCKKRIVAGDNHSISSIVNKLRETLLNFVKILNDENLMKIIQTTVQWITNEKKLKPIGINSILILSNIGNGGKLKSSSDFYEKMIPELISIIVEESNLEKYPSLVLETLECFYSLFSQSIISFSHIDEIWNNLLKIICDENDVKSEIRLESLKIFELFVSKKKKNESKILNHLEYLEQMTMSIIQLFKSQHVNDTNVIVIVKVFIYLFKLLDSNNGNEILHKVFKLLSKISNQTFDFDTNENITFRRMNILKLYIGLSSKYGERLQPYLSYMTPLIYRCCEFPKRDKSIVTMDLEKFAKECKQLIQQSVTPNDSTLFVKAYEEGRQQVQHKSEKKLKSREQEVISQPILFARKRLESNSKKNEKNKRKLKEGYQQATVQISSSGNVQQVKKKKKLK